MWTSILRRHFPSSSWKKYYSKIIFLSASVFHGLKPSFLWDVGPGVTPTQVLDFVKECKTQLKTNDRVLVICVGGNIFVANAAHCRKALSFDGRKFIEVGKDGFRLIEPSGDLNQMIGVLKEKFSNCEDSQIWDLNGTESVCPPCLFGLLLNYPLVYYFDGDYPPFPVGLKVYEVTCEFKLENVTGRFQVFAFSVPQSVLDTDIDSVVSFWFDSLRVSGENIFSNLSLESSFEEVDTLIL